MSRRRLGWSLRKDGGLHLAVLWVAVFAIAGVVIGQPAAALFLAGTAGTGLGYYIISKSVQPLLGNLFSARTGLWFAQFLVLCGVGTHLYGHSLHFLLVPDYTLGEAYASWHHVAVHLYQLLTVIRASFWLRQDIERLGVTLENLPTMEYLLYEQEDLNKRLEEAEAFSRKLVEMAAAMMKNESN